MNRRLRLACVAAVLATLLAVAGCSATPGLDTPTSAEWQSRVLAIAESAEAGDIPTALLDLDALEAETAQARTDGEISAERAAIIQQSIDVVRSDLEAEVAAPVTHAPEETATDDSTGTDSDEGDKGDKGNSENKGDNGKKNDDTGKKNDDD